MINEGVTAKGKALGQVVSLARPAPTKTSLRALREHCAMASRPIVTRCVIRPGSFQHA